MVWYVPAEDGFRKENKAFLLVIAGLLIAYLSIIFTGFSRTAHG